MPAVYNSKPMSDSFFGIVHLPTYIIGTVLVILLPGPNSLFVLSTAARRGVRLGAGAAFVGFGVKLATAAVN